MNNRTVSSYGAIGCLLLAICCAAAAGLLDIPPADSPDRGICLPSPGTWQLLPLASWGINLAVTLLCALGISLINKKYSLIKGTDHVLTSLFLVFCCGNMMISSRLTPAMILLPVALIAIAMLFGCYKARNSTQEIFVIATFLSIGSMLQYAFAALVVAVFFSAFVVKCMRAKEFCAFILGFVAPYWIGIGLGLIDFAQFHLPDLSLVIIPRGDQASAFVEIIACAILMVTAALLSLYNMVILYAGNSRIRSENNVVNIFGTMACICMIADFSNIAAYTGIFYFWAATQFANLFALRQIPRSWILFLIILAAILTFTILTVLL